MTSPRRSRRALDPVSNGHKQGAVVVKQIPYGDTTRIPGDDEPRRRRRKSKLPDDLRRFEWLTVDELSSLPAVEFLPGTPLAAGELSCLYGSGDSFKTFTALGWSCSLAAAGYVVVYIAAEGGSALHARVVAWMQAHGVERLDGLRVMPANVNLHRPPEVLKWLEAARLQLEGLKGELALVVVDTLARNFVGGSENDPKDMGQFVDGCERLRRELRSAVLVIHHTTKEGDSERGTESLRNASFGMFKITNKQAMKATFVFDRMKDVQKPERVPLVFQKVEFSRVVSGLRSSLALMTDITVSAGATATTPTGFRAVVLSALASVGATSTESALKTTELLELLRESDVKIKRQTALELLKEMGDDSKCPLRRKDVKRRSGQLGGVMYWREG